MKIKATSQLIMEFKLHTWIQLLRSTETIRSISLIISRVNNFSKKYFLSICTILCSQINLFRLPREAHFIAPQAPTPWCGPHGWYRHTGIAQTRHAATGDLPDPIRGISAAPIGHVDILRLFTYRANLIKPASPHRLFALGPVDLVVPGPGTPIFPCPTRRSINSRPK